MSIDYRRELADLYGARREPAVIDVPPLTYLMMDGQGDPNVSRDYADAVEALFSLAYTIKFALKRASGIDLRVMPLEGQWWCDDMRRFSIRDKQSWSWTMMILQPPEISAKRVEECRTTLASKKPLRALEKVRYASLEEGLCAQVIHVGPFDEEGPTIERLHEYIAHKGAKLTGKHHEIYLSDIRRAAPEKWRTIIRQPMQPA
jgi:hypothetical protein